MSKIKKGSNDTPKIKTYQIRFFETTIHEDVPVIQTTTVKGVGTFHVEDSDLWGIMDEDQEAVFAMPIGYLLNCRRIEDESVDKPTPLHVVDSTP